jgi:hypothetical protein
MFTFLSRFSLAARLASALGKTPEPDSPTAEHISRVRAAARIEEALRPFELVGLRTYVVAPQGNEGQVAVNLAQLDRATERSTTVAWIKVLLDGSIRFLPAGESPHQPRIAQTIVEAFRGLAVQPIHRDQRVWSVGGHRVGQADTGAWVVEDATGNEVAAHDSLEDALASARGEDAPRELERPLAQALALETTARAVAEALRALGVTAFVSGDRIVVQDGAGRHEIRLTGEGHLAVPDAVQPRTLIAVRRAAETHLRPLPART